jgi:hypothetical protein
MLHWIYIALMFLIMVVMIIEMFAEKNWRRQLAFAIAVIPLILAVLHIK